MSAIFSDTFKIQESHSHQWKLKLKLKSSFVRSQDNQ